MSAAVSDDWRSDRACRNRADITWFPGRGESAAPAIAVCTACPVRVECLDWAKSSGILHGVWGGVRLDSGAASDVSMDHAELVLTALTRNAWASCRQVRERTGLSDHHARRALDTLLNGGAVRRRRHLAAGRTWVWQVR